MAKLRLNGFDFSAFVQWKVDRLETTRKVLGPNSLVDIDGTEYPDVLANKIDPGFLLKPLPKTYLQQLAAIMEQDVIDLEYTSFRTNEDRAIKAIPQNMSLKFAVTAWNGDVYEGTAITFKEQ